jgi:hypothetical protein
MLWTCAGSVSDERPARPFGDGRRGCVVGTGRVELPTYRLGGGCSIQLSYVPTHLRPGPWQEPPSSPLYQRLPARQTLFANVAPDLHAVKADLVDGFVDHGDGFLQSVARVRDAKYAAARGDGSSLGGP